MAVSSTASKPVTANADQIYSATYSNVPVFEFVTSEGPIMRRKADSWINATHILKIARFPKAKRTRILEKDVQTGIHEKVQGGYGKYQGTYVPLHLGVDIAKTFGVYEILKPIFDFTYIEGQSATPPPAPKHTHASASNVAKRQASTGAASDSKSSLKRQRASTTPSLSEANAHSGSGSPTTFPPSTRPSTPGTTKKSTANKEDAPPKKRGRPKRVALLKNPNKPTLKQNNTTSVAEIGPSFGTFNNNSSSALSTSMSSIARPAHSTDSAFMAPPGYSQSHPQHPYPQASVHSQAGVPSSHPSLNRQDTEQDALQVMATDMNVKSDELELAEQSSDDEGEDANRHTRNNNKSYPQNSFHPRNSFTGHNDLSNASHALNHTNRTPQYTPTTHPGYYKHEDEDELMSVRELFGTPRDSFERIVNHHGNNAKNPHNNHNNNGNNNHINNTNPSQNSQPSHAVKGLSSFNFGQPLPSLQASYNQPPSQVYQNPQIHLNNQYHPNRSQFPSFANGSVSGAVAVQGITAGGSPGGDPYGLQQYHHDPSNENIYSNYIKTLINYICEDGANPGGSAMSTGGSSAGGNNAADLNGHPINHKARLNSIDIPETLLNPPQPLSKIDINQPIDVEGNTIFHWACSMGNITIIEFLLSIFSSFINSEVKNHSGETPLMFLVKFSNSYQLQNFPTLLDLLFDSILSVDNGGKTVLHHIALASWVDIENSGDIKSKEKKLATSTKKNKERFSRYYMECLMSKIIEFSEYQLSQDDRQQSTQDKKELVTKFINYQDNDGNTAFHIVAYNLNKKCIKVFLKYHPYLDLSLRNLVNYTVEDYLASHNCVLRMQGNTTNLEVSNKRTGEEDTTTVTIAADTGGSAISTKDMAIKDEGVRAKRMSHDGSKAHVNGDGDYPVYSQSFDSQLYHSKVAIDLHNHTASLITEKLTELSFAVDKELRKQDEYLFKFFKYMQLVYETKLNSQRDILRLFKLEYLLDDDVLVPGGGYNDDSQSDSGSLTPKTATSSPTKGRGDEATVVQKDANETANDDEPYIATQKDEDEAPSQDIKRSQLAEHGSLMTSASSIRDDLIQEEIERLVNDLSFSCLTRREELQKAVTQFNEERQKHIKQDLMREYKQDQTVPEQNDESDDQNLESAIELQREIAKSHQLMQQLTQKHLQVPVSYTCQVNASPASTTKKEDNEFNRPDEFKENAGEGEEDADADSVIAKMSPDDKLYKYCKLISICCGMSFKEVESSIDLIEQSLVKSTSATSK